MNIILIGPPGVGKGTQAKIIIKTFKIPHISSGDILRQNIRDKTELGLHAKTYMDAGKLVPDVDILNMIRNRLSEDDCKSGYILDGFPRTIPQAEGLDVLLADLDQELDHVLVFDADENMIVKRLSSRRSCKNCGRIYNLLFGPPANEKICDDCGGELIQRIDDKPETILKRLEVYKKQTTPLIRFYRKRDGLLRYIDAAGSIEQIKEQILKILG